jgi:adenosylcobinamide-GDP ribazoletransferase
VGGVAWGVATLTSPIIGGTVGVLCGVLITGAFHEDGLADVADAFVGGWSTQDRLRIIKDPLHGSYGVAALSGSIILRCVTLGSFSPSEMLKVAIATHCLARTGALALMLTTALARHDGLGADYVRALPVVRACVGIFAALVICALLLRTWVIVAVVATIIGSGAIRWLAQRKIGGITGDVLGAAEQASEMLTYVALSAR